MHSTLPNRAISLAHRASLTDRGLAAKHSLERTEAAQVQIHILVNVERAEALLCADRIRWRQGRTWAGHPVWERRDVIQIHVSVAVEATESGLVARHETVPVERSALRSASGQRSRFAIDPRKAWRSSAAG